MRPALRLSLFVALIAASYPATQGAVRVAEGRIEAARARAAEEKRREEEAPLVEEGRLEAERDLAAGFLRVRRYGYVHSISARAWELQKQKLGVEVVGVGGCMVPEDICLRARGYNGLMVAEIERRFGPGALDAAWEQALEEYRLRQEEEAKQAHAERK